MSVLISVLIAIFFGLIESVTEWLPVSSTAHLLLFDAVPGLSITERYGADFYELFVSGLELGAALAALIYFSRDLFLGKEKGVEENPSGNVSTGKRVWSIWLRIIVGCVPVGIVGLLISLLLTDSQKASLDSFLVIGSMLLVVGALFILIEYYLKIRTRKLGSDKPSFRYGKVSDLPVWVCAVIGVVQILSVIPGTSRSGVTIIVALLLGVSRAVSVRYSFYMSVPLLVCSSLLSFVSYGVSGAVMTGEMWGFFFLGMTVTFAISLLVIKALLGFVEKHTFNGFGIYRIALGALVIGLSLGGLI